MAEVQTLTPVSPQSSGSGHAGNQDEPRPGKLGKFKSFSRLFASSKRPSEVTVVETTPPLQTEGITEVIVMPQLERDISTSGDTLAEMTQDLSLTEEEEAGEERILKVATTLFKFRDPPAGLPPLPKPILIPRTLRGHAIPLVRAWAPEAARHDIAQDDFMMFIDTLNILSLPPMSATLLQVASIGIGFAPMDWADGVSAALALAAQGVCYYVVTRQCARFLAKMNESYFHPRRMHARVVGAKKLRRAMGFDRKDPLIAPLTEEVLTMSAQERCLEYMKDRSCELSYDVPDISVKLKRLLRIIAWNNASKARKFDRMVRRSRKRAWKKKQRGKVLKREGFLERDRARNLQWLLIQSKEDFDRQQDEDAAAKEEKRMAKMARKAKRSATWNSYISRSTERLPLIKSKSWAAPKAEVASIPEEKQ